MALGFEVRPTRWGLEPVAVGFVTAANIGTWSYIIDTPRLVGSATAGICHVLQNIGSIGFQQALFSLAESYRTFRLGKSQPWVEATDLIVSSEDKEMRISRCS